MNGIESEEVTIFDLSNLKDINDNYGHLVGDQMLEMMIYGLLKDEFFNFAHCRTDKMRITEKNIYRFGASNYIIISNPMAFNPNNIHSNNINNVHINNEWNLKSKINKIDFPIVYAAKTEKTKNSKANQNEKIEATFEVSLAPIKDLITSKKFEKYMSYQCKCMSNHNKEILRNDERLRWHKSMYNGGICIIAMDIDKLSKFSSEHGIKEASIVVKQLGDTIQRSINEINNETDNIDSKIDDDNVAILQGYYLSGDEFCIVSPSATQAVLVCRKIRTNLIKENCAITVTMGIANCYEIADYIVCQAKSDGNRNEIVIDAPDKQRQYEIITTMDNHEISGIIRSLKINFDDLLVSIRMRYSHGGIAFCQIFFCILATIIGTTAFCLFLACMCIAALVATLPVSTNIILNTDITISNQFNNSNDPDNNSIVPIWFSFESIWLDQGLYKENIDLYLSRFEFDLDLHSEVTHMDEIGANSCKFYVFFDGSGLYNDYNYSVCINNVE